MVDDRVDGLKSTCAQFDEGDLAAARGIAVHIRALVHHTTTSPALIHQLGLERELTWVDTAGVTHPKTETSVACLTLMNVGSGPQGQGGYVPKLDLYPPVPIRTRDGGRIDRGSRIPFEHWWTNRVVKDPDGVDYSRKQLVLALANDSAGVSDDPEMRAVYDIVARSQWLGWVVSGGNESASSNFGTNPLMASVRQIGHEAVQSIRQQRGLVDPMCAA
ncbi:MAG: hypothetical protein K0U84_10120 [Actinomycetia bacterium]|nr:hypothetical protein [Actinomycetes bacterium]